MADLVYKVGDTRPFLDATLKDANGAVDLSTGNSVEKVRFVLENSTAGEVVNATSTGSKVTLTTATAGKVRYEWQVGDLDPEGVYYAEWTAIYDDGTTARFPNTSHVAISVVPALSTST